MSDLNVYTTSQINALTPITGDMVVDSDLNAIKLYDGSAWRTFNSDSTAVPFNNEWGATFSSDYLETGSDPGLTVKTISYWFNQASSAETMIVSGLGGAAYTTYGGFGTSPNGTIRWNDGYGGGTSAANVFSYGTWNHFAAFHVPSGYADSAGTATANGAGWAIYVNNVRVDIQSAVAAYGTTPVTTTNKFKIGREGERASMYMFNGSLDEIALFTSSISASDVSDIYNSGTPVDLGADGLNLSPDIYYRMGDDSNDSPSAGGNITSISDSSGNGHNLTQSTASLQPTFSDLTGESIYA
jgi:hypothetical protein